MRQCFPFLEKFTLCPEIDEKDLNQKLGICDSKGEECEYIGCIHTAVCNIPAGDFSEVHDQLEQAETDKEKEEILQKFKPKSSEGRKINLPLEDKWLAFSSWAQGISEVEDPIELLQGMEEINKSYPIGTKILGYLVKHRYDFGIEKIFEQCENNRSCIISNIKKYKNFMPKEVVIRIALQADVLYKGKCPELVGYNSIEDIVGCTSKIQELYLNYDQLNELPKEIGNLVNLQILNLIGNQLTELPKEIGNLVNLQGLDLFNNHLKEVPIDIGNLINLIRLELSNNQLTEVPKEIGTLINIQELHIANNQLKEVPSEIGNLINLQELNLGNNQLTELPKEIGNLVNIQWIYLADNKLTELPKEIGNLINLQGLNLLNNKLTKVPKEIGNFVNLEELNLGYNELTEVPSEIENLVNLQKLNLYHNYLNELPNDMKQSKNPYLRNFTL